MGLMGGEQAFSQPTASHSSNSVPSVSLSLSLCGFGRCTSLCDAGSMQLCVSVSQSNPVVCDFIIIYYYLLLLIFLFLPKNGRTDFHIRALVLFLFWVRLSCQPQHRVRVRGRRTQDREQVKGS